MCQIKGDFIKSQELIVDIQKLSNLGLGIAKIEGYVIFVENTCPGDKVKIRINKKNKNFATATVLEIIKPSSYRIKPQCPMQKICGSCQLQFIDYEYQLKLKKEIVEDTMHNIFGQDIIINEVIASPFQLEYRHKIQYPVSQTKNSHKIIAGYYKPSSHQLVNIKYCPIQPKYCDNIIEFIRNSAKKFNVTGYNEKKHSGDLRHVLIRVSSYNKKNLITLVINSKKMLENVKKLAECIYTELDNISGIAVNYNFKKTNLILGDTTEVIYGESFVEEKLCDKIFKISPGTFFQINPHCANEIFNYIKNFISTNYQLPMLLDAYAGISTFGITLSDVVKKAICVEFVKESTDLASKIIRENGIKNVEIHNMDAAKFFEKELNTKNRKFDISIIDPPRKGCSTESLDYLLKLTKDLIIYVSCNPATLARDLKYLNEKGAKIISIQPFDMFPHTYHIENVAIIKLFTK